MSLDYFFLHFQCNTCGKLGQYNTFLQFSLIIRKISNLKLKTIKFFKECFNPKVIILSVLITTGIPFKSELIRAEVCLNFNLYGLAKKYTLMMEGT